MPKAETEKQPPKQYLEKVPRRYVYGGLIVFAVLAALLFLCVPHYKPLHLASANEINYAHQDIIKKYFVNSTTCKQDNLEKTDRIKTFNKYFAVNKYGNRAVIRGCHDHDTLLTKDDQGKWQRTDVSIVLSMRQNPERQKACLIDDITKMDSKVRPVNALSDAKNLKICESLAKESYVEVNFKQGIHFHF